MHPVRTLSLSRGDGTGGRSMSTGPPRDNTISQLVTTVTTVTNIKDNDDADDGGGGDSTTTNNNDNKGRLQQQHLPYTRSSPGFSSCNSVSCTTRALSMDCSCCRVPTLLIDSIITRGHCNQDPRWTQKPRIPYVYTPYLLLITRFSRNSRGFIR